jgi:hypothetical protein
MIQLPFKRPQITGGEIALWLVLLLWLGLLLSIATFPAYGLAAVLQRRIGTERQRLADASVLQFTRDPEPFIGLLIKATALTGHDMRLKPVVREFSQLTFASLPGFPVAEHIPVVSRVQSLDASISGDEVLRLQRAAIEKFERESAIEVPVEGSVNAPPDPWQRMREAMSTLEAGQALDPVVGVLCMLVDRLPEVRNKQLDFLRSTLSPKAHATLVKFMQGYASLSRGVRLAVLEVYLAQLRDLPAGQRHALLQQIRSLVQLDVHTDVFELAIVRLAQIFLDDLSSTRLLHGDRRLEQYPREVQDVLSVMTQFSARRQPDEVFRAGVRALGRVMPIEFSPRVLWAPIFLRALDALERLQPAEKAALLAACATIAGIDGMITDDEHQLLRVLAVSMHCPAPRVPVQDT